MSPKTLLHRVVCALLILSFIAPATAQQRRIMIGNLWVKPPHPKPPKQRPPLPIILLHAPFRSYDGTYNNISNRDAMQWGASNIPLFREMPTAYGSADPKNAMAGSGRPTPRKISNMVSDEPVTHFNDRELSTFVYVWGQFIDHDMSSTPTDTIEYVPVTLPPDEPLFNQPIPFYRSAIWPGSGVTSPRQQMNLTTSWIDASMVYGPDSARAKWLRTFKSGHLKTSTGNYLPYNTTTGEESGPIDPTAPSMANDAGKTIKTFVAGDERAAEHPGIAGMHTLFVREHNRICDRLVSQGLRGDELIYQMARKEVSALIQAITYQEFLPAMGVTLNRYSGYRSQSRPDIMNSFATAAYRIGHTMVADDIFLRSNLCVEVAPGELDLVAVFWNPDVLPTYGMEAFMKGFASHTQYETDTKINSVLRNFLFNNNNPSDPTRFGIDLASLNIQRGRDHGLPDYNSVRKFYTGNPATNFHQITSDSSLADSLQKLYGNVNNIDLWVGVLAEDHLANASMGRTMHQMLKLQFENLRDGDYYFYLNDPYLPPSTRATVSKTKFSDVLKRNTSLTNLQSNVFFTSECAGDEEEAAAAPAADTSALLSETPVSAPISVSPNPSSGSIQVNTANMSGPFVVKIYSSNNVLVKTVTVTSAKQASVPVNLSGMANGTYFVSVSNGTETKTTLFIKQ